MNIKKIFLAACIASAVISSPASAGVLGMADLAITGLALVTRGGVPVVGGITIIGDQRTGNASSNFNGVSAADSTTANGTVDVTYKCTGPDCAAAAGLYGLTGPENNSTSHIAVPSLNYALGDMLLAGSIVSQTGATGVTRADTSVNAATNIGGAAGSINNSASARTSISFTLADDTTANGPLDAQFVLNYNVFRKVFVDVISTMGAATAGTSFNLTLTGNGFTKLIFAPEELNDSIGAFSADDNSVFSQNGTLFSDFRTFQSNVTYTLSITQSSLSSASEIPEPASVLLVGLSLLGLGVARRRRG